MSGDLHFIDDLLSRDLLDAGHAKPARLAVIGCPVTHSASPRMHQPALDEAGIDGRYIKVEVEPGQVAEAFARMQALGFIGCNVTVPHKFEAMAACTSVDPGAVEMGAVNTVCFARDGIHGFNTDGPGFEAAVSEAFSIPLAGLDVLIVGAGGGAGGALAAHCARAGVSRLVLANRSLDKIESLAGNIRGHHPQLAVESLALDAPRLPGVARTCQLVVNASSVGLKASDPSPLPRESFAPGQRVFDTIYQPPRTALLSDAAAAGAEIANGATMLLHQGVHAFRLWFPGSDPASAMRRGLAAP
ncbi:shikimate dehydrogenase family protein [Luteolibacter marinus]|uniref:shikimate dehydrogenase family protein n=1 Tax=Luteolibacter marinus TaxID=2776705 RepID=UPI0018678000|nr:shikimate dehydrogenase [Luteolibacter marinus]